MDCKLQAKLKNTCWPHAVWQKGALMAHIPLLTVMSHVAGEFGCCVRWGKKVRLLVACLLPFLWSILLLYYTDHVCILIIEHLIMNMRHLMHSNYWRGVNDITSSRRWHNNLFLIRSSSTNITLTTRWNNICYQGSTIDSVAWLHVWKSGSKDSVLEGLLCNFAQTMYTMIVGD